MQGLQILVDGFAISSLYALGAIGFTLIFGVSGILNLAHGGIMVTAALIGWYSASHFGVGPYLGTVIGIIAGLVAAYVTYICVARPIQRSRRIPHEETEIFVLTGTLLFGIMIQDGLSYIFSDNPVAMQPLISGITNIGGVRVPTNEVMITIICWVVIGLLWLLINRTRAGKAMLAASMNPKGVALLGFDISHIHLFVWTVYGVLAGLAGVLLASFLGAGTSNSGDLTASAFAIVVLGGLGSVSGSLLAAYIVGYFETATAYLISPALRPIPALIVVLLVVYLRPQGLFGRQPNQR